MSARVWLAVISVAAVTAAIWVLLPLIDSMTSASRRDDAMNSLLRAQILQLRWHASHGHYGSVTDIWILPGGHSPAGYYVLSDAPEILPAGPSETAYTMQAVPQGRQENDPCGTFVITAEGPLLQPPWAGADCWVQ